MASGSTRVPRRFGFRSREQSKKIKDLSGGERNRAQLASVVREGGNVLVLDEPTNDLDVGTLRALEEAILGFAGTVLVVSHDRFFLDRVATHILAFEGDSHGGSVTWKSQYLTSRRRRVPRARNPAAGMSRCSTATGPSTQRTGSSAASATRSRTSSIGSSWRPE